MQLAQMTLPQQLSVRFCTSFSDLESYASGRVVRTEAQVQQAGCDAMLKYDASTKRKIGNSKSTCPSLRKQNTNLMQSFRSDLVSTDKHFIGHDVSTHQSISSVISHWFLA